MTKLNEMFIKTATARFIVRADDFGENLTKPSAYRYAALDAETLEGAKDEADDLRVMTKSLPAVRVFEYAGTNDEGNRIYRSVCLNRGAGWGEATADAYGKDMKLAIIATRQPYARHNAMIWGYVDCNRR